MTVALPAHTIHRTQVLDYSVFWLFQNFVRGQFNKRVIGTYAGRRNDCFTICDMGTKEYLEAVTFRNIVNGFNTCGLWCLRGGGISECVINTTDITNRQEGRSCDVAYHRYQDLYKDSAKSRDTYLSNDVLLQSRHLNTAASYHCACYRNS